MVVAALLPAALGLTLAATDATGQVRATPNVAPRPNIVFVLTDDLSMDLLQYMPHVQALVQEGVSLSKFFVVDSLCCPSRSSIFTGLFPHNDGVFSNEGPDGGYDAFNANGNVGKTYALALQDAGYQTGLMGKYLNGYKPELGVPRGWDEWDVAGNGYPEFGYELNENGTLHDYGHKAGDYLTDVLSEKASTFITTNATQQRPFALEIAPFAPHQPAVPAPRDADKFSNLTAPHGPTWDKTPTNAPSWLAQFPKLTDADKAKIDKFYLQRVRCVQAVDRMVGHLQNLLQQLGIADNTYVVFSSDNGYHLGEYRLRPGKRTAFDTDIHVPLIVAGPGVPAGETISAVTPSIDLAPTFAQVAGTQLGAATDGTSMLDLWHGTVPANWPKAVLIEHHQTANDPNDPDRQSQYSGDPPSYEAVRTANALYVEYVNGDTEYYDLGADPQELHNIAHSAPTAKLNELRTTLHELERCGGANARCPGP
jgi:arylsulfatase A-like enzyme